MQGSINQVSDAIRQVSITPESNIRNATMKVQNEPGLSPEDQSLCISFFADHPNKAGAYINIGDQVRRNWLQRELAAYKKLLYDGHM